MSSSEDPAAATINIMDNPVHLSFSHFCSELDDLLCNFHDFSETTTVIDELEEFYKPFYPVATTPDFSTVKISQPVPEEIEALKQPSDKVAVQDLQEPAASKSKKSKNNKQKNKRVEYMIAAEGVSDQWAWRKYGQKPIKGSPYPRSYYRCSSAKGCLARKQVERSHLDPAVFIITYTAEHTHPQPTRKNSQARSSTGKNSSTVIAPPRTHEEQSTLNSPNITAALLSPDQTPGVVEPITDEHVPSTVEQGKGVKKEEGVVEDDGLFQSIELEELNEIDHQQLALDGYGFMDSTIAADTCFG